MKITEHQLRQLIREAINDASSDLRSWAQSVGLQVDIDPLTGEEIVLISDSFAMQNELPDGTGWGVERARDDSGWIVTASAKDNPDSMEIASGDLSDLDDIGISTRGY